MQLFNHAQMVQRVDVRYSRAGRDPAIQKQISINLSAREAVQEAHQKSLIQPAKVLCESCYIGIHSCVGCQSKSDEPLAKCKVQSCGNYLYQSCGNEGVCRAHTCSECKHDFRVGEKWLAACVVCDRKLHFNFREIVSNLRKSIADDQAELT